MKTQVNKITNCQSTVIETILTSSFRSALGNNIVFLTALCNVVNDQSLVIRKKNHTCTELKDLRLRHCLKISHYLTEWTHRWPSSSPSCVGETNQKSKNRNKDIFTDGGRLLLAGLLQLHYRRALPLLVVNIH